jgi:preprotein translocase subunit SecF
MIRVSPQNEQDQTEVATKIKQVLDSNFPNQFEYRKTDFVGPQVGSELIKKGFMALTMSFILMMFYIWIRFDWQFGIGGVLALIHDAILTIGFFSITQLEFDLTSVAAILTIIGYSINDSVVIYDRIREYMRKYKKKEIDEILNLSINSTLSRTVLTGGSTLVALVALIFLGGEVLRSFSVSVFFGIIVGTYSSIYISAPVLLYMNIDRSGNKK